jgi:4-hydroxy-tetrahydrodipicolinate synthase
MIGIHSDIIDSGPVECYREFPSETPCEGVFTNRLTDLYGVVPPMFTPFHEDDRIDHEALAIEARFLRQSGVSGIVVGGSMGEGAGVSDAELAEAVRVVIEAVNGEIPVLAGVIADSSAEAVRLSKAVRSAGASGLQVPPPHFRPAAETRALAEYYRAITDASGLPLIIYNVMPTAEAAVESLDELIAANPAIAGVKQSARNMHTLAALLATMRGRVKLFSAIDDMVYPSFVLGVDGTISGTSAVFPRETVEMFKAVQAGDYDRALRLHERLAPVWRAIDHPDFPARSKYAVVLSGRSVGKPRRPFRFPVGEAARSIEQAMSAGGFLSANRSVAVSHAQEIAG